MPIAGHSGQTQPTAASWASLPGGIKPPPVGPYVVLFTEDGELSVLAKLGAPPKVTGGGGIEHVERQGRRPLTRFRGGEPVTIEFEDLLLDGYRARQSVEPAIRAIEKMAGALVGESEQPEKLIMVGAAVPHDFGKSSGARWVISDPPDWTDPVVRVRSGDRIERTRQAVNLKLALWVDGDELERIDPAQGKPDFKEYIAKKGDTFNSVAGRKLGNALLGGELAKLNRELNPAFRGAHPTAKTKINPGVHVRLPSSHLKAEWERERRNRPRR